MRANKESSRTDWAKFDAHVIQPHEYDELPEWTDETFEQADLYENGKLVRRGRGRPRATTPKVSQNIRLDADILAFFRAGGRGWQTRMNDALREWVNKSGA